MFYNYVPGPLSPGSSALTMRPTAPPLTIIIMLLTLGHAGYAQTTREKLISHCEKTLSYASLNICTVCPILSNIRIQVEQVFSRYTNIVKEKLGIVDSIQAHFVSHVMNLDSWHHIEILISNRNQDTMDTWKENNQFICNIGESRGEETWVWFAGQMYLKFQLALQRSTSQLLPTLDNSSLGLFLFQ